MEAMRLLLWKPGKKNGVSPVQSWGNSNIRKNGILPSLEDEKSQDLVQWLDRITLHFFCHEVFRPNPIYLGDLQRSNHAY